MPPALAQAGVPVVFREAKGNIHGFITLRKAIPSSVGDVAGALAALKDVIVEAEGDARDGAGRGMTDPAAPALSPLRRGHAAQRAMARCSSGSGSIRRWKPGRCRRAGSTRARMR